MQNNRNAIFGMRRMIAAGMAVLVMLGANDEYIALCRKHFNEGKLSADDPGDHPEKS